MSTAPYSQMAKEFMELWQKQLASVMSDKQFIHAMLEMIQSMQMPYADTAHSAKNAATAANTADAPDAFHGDLAQLAYRLKNCERRLAALEKKYGQGDPPTKAAKKPAPRGKKPKQ